MLINNTVVGLEGKFIHPHPALYLCIQCICRYNLYRSVYNVSVDTIYTEVPLYIKYLSIQCISRYKLD